MGYGDLGDSEPGVEDPHAASGSAGARGDAVHRRAQFVGHLHAQPLRAADRPLSLAEVSRHRELVRSAGARRRPTDAAARCSSEGLPHRLHRQVASRLGLGRDQKARRTQAPKTKAGYAPDAFDWSKPIPGGPLAHGFDYYFGDDVPNFPPYAWFENDRVITPPTETADASRPRRPKGRGKRARGRWRKGWDFYAVVPTLTERAVEWIGEQRGKDGAVLPVLAVQLAARADRADERVSRQIAGRRLRRLHGPDGCTTSGEFCRRCEDNGFAERHAGDLHCRQRAERYAYDRIRNFGHRSSGPLRGLKRDLWEGGHRVPFARPLARHRAAADRQRCARQPGRRDGDAGRRRRLRTARGLGPRQLQSAARLDRGRTPARAAASSTTPCPAATRCDTNSGC